MGMRRTLVLPLLFAILLPHVLWAQDGPPEKPAKPEPKKKADPQPELHKIYVPYKKLDELLGTDKERVMVPYKEFLELWNLKYGPKASAAEPPVPFAVESARYDGRVQNGLVVFQAVLQIEVFAEGWQRIPLGFSRIAFEDIAVDGKPGVLTPTRGGYELLLQGKGRHKVEARLVAGIARGKEVATCEFGLPPVPLHRLTFRVPGKGTEVGLEPARASSTKNDGDETVLLAFLGPQRKVKLKWRYKPEETEREPSLVFSTDIVDLRVEERSLRGLTRFELKVLRTPTEKFVVEIPEGVQVLEVSGARLRTWNFTDEARRRLEVRLHKPAIGSYTFEVRFERTVSIQVPGIVAVPALRLVDASRERGFVRVTGAEGVAVRPGALENAFQSDLNSLPKAIRGGRGLGFRFATVPYSIGLVTERIEPLVSLVHRARLNVGRRLVSLHQELQFDVERTGLFSVRVHVPDGITLTDIGTPQLVDTWREIKEDGKRILVIELRGRRMGKFTLPFKGEMELDLGRDPKEDLKNVRLQVPLLSMTGADREEGTLGVFMDAGLKASAKTKSVVPLEPKEFVQKDRYRSPAGLPLAFAWRWRGEGPEVAFTIEKRKPKVTCDVHYRLEAGESRVQVRAELHYNVQYSGVETFSFRVPKSIRKNLKVDVAGFREKEPKDDTVKDGDVPTTTWTVTMQRPVLGKLVIVAEYDETFPQPLQTGQSRPVAIPAIVPLNLDRTNAFVAIRKAPTIKVDPAGTDYEQIDPAELPQALRGNDVFVALRRLDTPESFRLDLTKHEYQPVADLVVRHAHLKTVLVDDGLRATTQAFFEILNNDRQFLAVKLPDGTKLEGLRVGGKPETPRTGEGGVTLVRLPTGLKKDATFVVALAYSHPVQGSGGLRGSKAMVGPVLPAFDGKPAPRQLLLTWSVHYPRDWVLTSFDGNVAPARGDDEKGSWLRLAIGHLAALVRPVKPPPSDVDGITLAPARFDKMLVPMYVSGTAHTLFTNGNGDAQVTLHHTTRTAGIVFAILGLIGAAACVIVLGRSYPTLTAGLAVVGIALVALAFAGPGWTSLWNGALIGGLVGTLVALVRGKKPTVPTPPPTPPTTPTTGKETA